MEGERQRGGMGEYKDGTPGEVAQRSFLKLDAHLCFAMVMFLLNFSVFAQDNPVSISFRSNNVVSIYVQIHQFNSLAASQRLAITWVIWLPCVICIQYDLGPFSCKLYKIRILERRFIKCHL